MLFLKCDISPKIICGMFFMYSTLTVKFYLTDNPPYLHLQGFFQRSDAKALPDLICHTNY